MTGGGVSPAPELNKIPICEPKFCFNFRAHEWRVSEDNTLERFIDSEGVEALSTDVVAIRVVPCELTTLGCLAFHHRIGAVDYARR